MKTIWLTAIAVSALLISLVATVCPCPVKADSTDSIRFDSGVTVFSPLNMTYYYSNLVLNLSLYSAGCLGSLDSQISLNYSIDGVYNGSVPLRSNGEMHVTTLAVATVNLPEVPDGSHYLTIYLYGFNQRTYEPTYLSYVNTIYFSTIGNPALSPTTTPALTLAPTPHPSNLTTSNLSTLPTIPEYTFSVILPLLVSMLCSAIILTYRKTINLRK